MTSCVSTRLFAGILQEVREKPEDVLHNESIKFNTSENIHFKIKAKGSWVKA
jgi:hypothetical protein